MSLVTVCFNSESTIEKTIISVLNQDYIDLEYIIIDGHSTDRTFEIVSKYESQISKIISESDNGIYDALNKGLKFSRGDIIGFIHSDDILAYNGVITDVVSMFKKDNYDLIWGNLMIKNHINNLNERFYSGKDKGKDSFQVGMMPPHPSTFVKSKVYERFGNFNLSYKIASDYDLLFRFIVLADCRYAYLDKTLIIMSNNGLSNKSFYNKLLLNFEIFKIHKAHDRSITFFQLLKKIPLRFKEIKNARKHV